MYAVLFELQPNVDRDADYFETAEKLRPLLETIDGFISIERFESVSQPGKYLSLSFWRDEAAIQSWRNTMEHREAQRAGRSHVFQDYRLRVANVVRDYGLHERDEAPQDSQVFHEWHNRSAKYPSSGSGRRR